MVANTPDTSEMEVDLPAITPLADFSENNGGTDKDAVIAVFIQSAALFGLVPVHTIRSVTYC